MQKTILVLRYWLIATGYIACCDQCNSLEDVLQLLSCLQVGSI